MVVLEVITKKRVEKKFKIIPCPQLRFKNIDKCHVMKFHIVRQLKIKPALLCLFTRQDTLRSEVVRLREILKTMKIRLHDIERVSCSTEIILLNVILLATQNVR